jgi:addiction module HigA family antidote
MATKVFAPIHPGEHLLEDFMRPQGISQTRLASDLGIPFRRVNEIVGGKRAITAETALLLGRYFDMSPEFWLRLQADYDLEVERERIGDRLERVRMRQHA